MSRLMKVAAAIALALILLSAAATAGGLYARFEQTNANRRANAQIWHAVICDIEKNLILSPKNDNARLTTPEKRRALAYYDRLLVQDAHAAPCGLLVTGR